jgi:hypothetical protein
MKRLAIAATVPTLLLVGLPATARADVAPDRPTLVFQTGGDLYKAAPDGTGRSRMEKIAPDGAFISDTSASADGSRFTYVVGDVLGSQPGHQLLRTRIGVRDAGGRLVGYVAQVETGLGIDSQDGYVANDPALAPGANELVWTLAHAGTSVLKEQRVTDTTAVTLPYSSGLSAAAWTGAGLLALKDNHLVALPTGQAPKVVHNQAAKVWSFRISPDGSTIAYRTDADELVIAPLTLNSDGTATIGATTATVPLDSACDDPQFSHDGQTLYFAVATSESDQDIFSVPVTGGTPTDLTNTPNTDEDRPVGLLLDNGVAPGVPVLAGPARFGEHGDLLMRFRTGKQGDVSGVSIVRTAPGEPTKTRFVPGQLESSYHDLSLYSSNGGKTYTYTLRTVDRSGNVSAEAATLQAFPTYTVALVPPTTTYRSTSAPFRLHLLSGASWNVSYRTNGTGPFVRWITGGTNPDPAFGLDGGTVARRGDSYMFRVQAFDAYGNDTEPRIVGTATVPIDQTQMTFTGATASIGAKQAFFGTERVLRPGASASFKATGNKLTVVAAVCSVCGILDVSVDGVHIGAADTYSVERYERQDVYRAFLNPGTHHIVLTSRGKTLSRPDVILDGAAVRR